MALLLSIPAFPEVVDWLTAKDDGEDKADAAGDDGGKGEANQGPDDGDLAKDALIEEQDGKTDKITAGDVEDEEEVHAVEDGGDIVVWHGPDVGAQTFGFN
jgi:hypothetical protein